MSDQERDEKSSERIQHDEGEEAEEIYEVEKVKVNLIISSRKGSFRTGASPVNLGLFTEDDISAARLK